MDRNRRARILAHLKGQQPRGLLRPCQVWVGRPPDLPNEVVLCCDPSSPTEVMVAISAAGALAVATELTRHGLELAAEAADHERLHTDVAVASRELAAKLASSSGRLDS